MTVQETEDVAVVVDTQLVQSVIDVEELGIGILAHDDAVVSEVGSIANEVHEESDISADLLALRDIVV